MKVLPLALSRERLKEVLDFDPAAGKFIWRRPTSNRVRAGEDAGSPDGHGYPRIRIDGKRYFCHHLAWLWVNGVWPSAIDHINGDPRDYRI